MHSFNHWPLRSFNEARALKKQQLEGRGPPRRPGRPVENHGMGLFSWFFLGFSLLFMQISWDFPMNLLEFPHLWEFSNGTFGGFNTDPFHWSRVCKKFHAIYFSVMSFLKRADTLLDIKSELPESPNTKRVQEHMTIAVQNQYCSYMRPRDKKKLKTTEFHSFFLLPIVFQR